VVLSSIISSASCRTRRRTSFFFCPRESVPFEFARGCAELNAFKTMSGPWRPCLRPRPPKARVHHLPPTKAMISSPRVSEHGPRSGKKPTQLFLHSVFEGEASVEMARAARLTA